MELSPKGINIQNIEPCYKSINELEEYLLVNYNAKFMEKGDERILKFAKYNKIGYSLTLRIKISQWNIQFLL